MKRVRLSSWNFLVAALQIQSCYFGYQGILRTSGRKMAFGGMIELEGSFLVLKFHFRHLSNIQLEVNEGCIVY